MAAELRVHLFAFALIVICMEAFLLSGGLSALSGESAAPALATVSSSAAPAAPAFPRGAFTLVYILLFLFFSLLGYFFSILVRGKAAAFLPLLPAALLFLLVQKTKAPLFISAAVLPAAAVRLFFSLIPRKEKVILYGVFALDGAAAYLCFGRQVLLGSFATDKLLFVSLTVLTLASLQELVFEKGRAAFPFFYFALLGILVAMVPMRLEPIDWTPVTATALHAVHTARNMADGVSYYLSSVWGGSYTAGYSSLDVSGGRIGQSDRTQIILKTSEKPYYGYVDEETSAYMHVRRVLYLAGGRGVDKPQLVRFLSFLHACSVDKEYAALFSRISEVNVEYAYLNTADEIAPANAILLYAEGSQADGAPPGTKIDHGVSPVSHKKGYRINARYLDIDYGSPYLDALLIRDGTPGQGDHYSRENASRENTQTQDISLSQATLLSYEDACVYFKDLYRMDLSSILTEKEYREAADDSFSDADLDTGGASDRLRTLADELTSGASGEYDKCRLIESYLRQYPYRTDAVGGHDLQSDMRTSAGMADIADRFLFDTGAGYCVHNTASMIMLLRLAGIPARAVAGYRYTFPFEQADAYDVSSSCAHMWPEAYLGNAGWVPFEPTGAYRTAAEFTWHRRSAAVPADEAAQSAAAEAQPGSASSLPGIPDIPGANRPEVLPENLPADPAASPAYRFIRIALPVILSIVLLATVLILGSFVAAKLRYLRGTPEQKLIMDVDMIKKGIRRQSPEDIPDRGLLSDYAAKAPKALRADIQRVFSVYYRTVYGNRTVNGVSCSSGVTPEENELAKTLREQLLRQSPRQLMDPLIASESQEHRQALEDLVGLQAHHHCRDWPFPPERGGE